MRVGENREVQVRPACEQLLGVLRLGPLGAVEHGPVAGVVREPAGQLVCDPGAHVGMQHPERPNRRPVTRDPVHDAGAPVLLGQPVAVGYEGAASRHVELGFPRMEGDAQVVDEEVAAPAVVIAAHERDRHAARPQGVELRDGAEVTARDNPAILEPEIEQVAVDEKGDLFDFWFEYGSVIPRRHFGTVAKLHALRARGVPITFVGGNHDRWGGDFLIHDLGIAFHPGEAELDVAGRRAFVAHGDGLTEQHWSARVMHRITRHRATIRAFRMLHPDVGSWIAHQLSRKLADNTRDRAVLDRAERAQAQYAQQLLGRRPDLELVILAHTHRPALSQLPNGRAYLNPGAFLDGGRYAVVTKNNVELNTFH